MKRFSPDSSAWAFSALVLAVFMIPAAASAVPVTGEYSSGLKFKSEDGDFEFKLNGRVQFDQNFLDGEDDMPNVADGVEFRRLRHTFSGTLYKNTVFKAQVDFATGSAVLKDAFFGLKKTPLLGFGMFAGYVYQPMGLETMTSDNYITLVERSMASELAPDRQSCFAAYRKLGDQKATLWMSTFRTGDRLGKDVGDGLWNAAGRLSWTPMGTNPDEGYIHLAGSTAYRKNADRTFSVTAAPPAHLAPDMSEVAIPASNWMTYCAEAAWVQGPFSVQGEGIISQTSGRLGAADATALSYYGMVSFFVTGEGRPYDTVRGTFSRVSPKSVFDGESGHGALELALRFDVMDLEDDALNGGTTTNLTLGANWYLHRHSRIMLNVIRSEGDGTSVAGEEATDPRIQTDGVIYGLVSRFQVDF